MPNKILGLSSRRRIEINWEGFKSPSDCFVSLATFGFAVCRLPFSVFNLYLLFGVVSYKTSVCLEICCDNT